MDFFLITPYIKWLLDRYESGDDDNYSQPRLFWHKVLDGPARERLVKNICTALCKAYKEIQDRCVEEFRKVYPELGEAVNKGLANAVITNFHF
jgi:catalase